MSYIQVTARELKNRAEGLRSLNGQLKNKAAELLEKETALCNMWEGEARDAFHQAFSKDQQQMTAFQQLIGQYVQALLEIAARYEQAEAKNKEIAAARNY